MTCTICLENANQITTYCGHVFHQKCLTTALMYRPTCPVCRRLLVPIVPKRRVLRIILEEEVIYQRQFAVFEAN